LSKVALLDRDGTIIIDKTYLSDPDGIEFAPGAVEGMKMLRDAGIGMALITNQSGIARGYFDEATLARIHVRLVEMLAALGLTLDRIYYCPHGPEDGCDCRKPLPGMIENARRDLGFPLSKAVVIGDGAVDMGAAKAAGVRGIHITDAVRSEFAVPDFLSAARIAIKVLQNNE
jgi:D-glycero-D-manno-heptose 1,7-bisphosphate phosphatase